MIETPMLATLGRFLDMNAFRTQLILSNMANVDTPRYRTLDLNFAQELARADGPFQYANLSPLVQPVRGLLQRPDGNNVSLERESLLLAETQLRFNQGVQLLRDEFKTLLSAIREGSSS